MQGEHSPQSMSWLSSWHGQMVKWSLSRSATPVSRCLNLTPCLWVLQVDGLDGMDLCVGWGIESLYGCDFCVVWGISYIWGVPPIYIFKRMILWPICWSDRVVTEKGGQGGKMGEVWRWIYLAPSPPSPFPSNPPFPLETSFPLSKPLSPSQSASPISPEDFPLPCLPSLNWSWPEIGDYPWPLPLKNVKNCHFLNGIIWQ